VRTALSMGAIAVTLVCAAPAVAVAEPIPLANIEESKSTVDGWKIKVSLNEATINSVPNMANAIIVREGFITATATLNVAGDSDIKVKTSLAMIAQIGCQVNTESGLTLDFRPSIASSLPVLDSTPSPEDFALAPTGAFTPEFIATLHAGDITDQSLGEMAYPPPPDLDNDDSSPTDPLTVSVKDYHIKINKCTGPVAVRLLVQGTIKTAKSFDYVRTYSDILSL
jgi:hypothetical protein